MRVLQGILRSIQEKWILEFQRHKWTAWASAHKDEPLAISGNCTLPATDPEAILYVQNVITIIRQGLSLRSQDHLLDVGCGGGSFLAELVEDVGYSCGVDFIPDMVNAARTNVPQASFVVAEARRLPFHDASFDKVLCYSVFQYFPNLEYAYSVLHELMRVCTPNGRVFIGDIFDLAKKPAFLQFHKAVKERAGLRPLSKYGLGARRGLKLVRWIFRRLFFGDFSGWYDIGKLTMRLQSQGHHVSLCPHEHNMPSAQWRTNIVVQKS